MYLKGNVMNMRSLGVGTQEECGLRLCSQIKVHESSHGDSSVIYFDIHKVCWDKIEV